MAKYEVAWKEYHYSIIEATNENDATYKAMEREGIKGGEELDSTYEYANLRYCRKVFNENEKL